MRRILFITSRVFIADVFVSVFEFTSLFFDLQVTIWTKFSPTPLTLYILEHDQVLGLLSPLLRFNPMALPSELWREIFEIAVFGDPILEPRLIGPLQESTWFQMIFGEWWLRQPDEALRIQQRKSYATKKAINLVCRAWAIIGVEFLFRSILVADPSQLRKLCAIFDGNAKLGRFVKGIYIYSDGRVRVRDLSVMNMDDCIISLVRHCPNLQVFMVDPTIGPSFAIVADALRTYCRSSLKLLQWKVPFENQSKVTPAISCFAKLEALQIHLTPALPDQNKTVAGIRAMRDISFPCLKQLSLRGAVQDIAEQIDSWHLPSLDSLTIDFGGNRHDFPDILELLGTIGPQLETLDLNSIPPLNVPSILSICPSLKTFCFNLDWQLEGMLVERPHQNIENIGLYGLRHAFGVGFAGEVAMVNSFEAIILRRMNDINFAAIAKTNFPKLKLVRVLDTGVLNDLNKNNGPAEGICFLRWERWWEQCAGQRVRLEDCTGNLLGTLPGTDDDDLDEEGSDTDIDHSSTITGVESEDAAKGHN